MTILNINVRPDRVLLGMDTLVLNTADGSKVDMSKFGVLPEANAVVAWRGDRILHANIFLECFAANVYADLDVLEPILPQLIVARAALVRDHYANLGAPQEFLDNPLIATVEMMLAGWSKAASDWSSRNSTSMGSRSCGSRAGRRRMAGRSSSAGRRARTATEPPATSAPPA